MTAAPGLRCLSPLDDACEWSRLVDGSPYHDTYYRPEYVRANVSRDQSAVGVVVVTGARRFLVPLILRTLSFDFAPEVEGYDAITPYGYGGVLPLEQGEVSSAEACEFMAQLRHICAGAGIVSCLIRLHPMIEQQCWIRHALTEGIDLQIHGETTGVDLAWWDEEREAPAGMHRDRRGSLNRARRELRVTSTAGDAPNIENALEAFRNVYNITMERQNASGFYFFPDVYYTALAQGLGERLAVILCHHGEVLVGGALFFADTHLAHYHLSGSNALGRAFRAPTMAVVAGAEWARRRGCRWLHLGGGVNMGDELLRFKSSFGGPRFQYGFVKIIADEQRYAQLVSLRRDCVSLGPMRESFFPAYRA